MQEEGTVGWDPIWITRPTSWESKVFVLYLLAVLLFLVVRSITLLRKVRALRGTNDKFLYIWEICMVRVASMKRLALFTLLLSVLFTANSAVTVLTRMQETRAAWGGAVAGAMAEVLTLFELGLFVCAALYAVASLYDGALARRRASWNYSSSQARRAD